MSKKPPKGTLRYTGDGWDPRNGSPIMPNKDDAPPLKLTETGDDAIIRLLQTNCRDTQRLKVRFEALTEVLQGMLNTDVKVSKCLSKIFWVLVFLGGIGFANLALIILT